MNRSLLDWTQERIEEAMRNVVLLGRVRFNAQLDAPTVHTVFTCPPGKMAIPLVICFHDNSASLAGMTDVNIGGGPAAIAPVWLDNQSLGAITVAGSFSYMWPDSKLPIDGDAATQANRSCVIEVVAGSTGAAYVTCSVIGFLIDS